MERCFNVLQRDLLARALALGLKVRAAQYNGRIFYAVPVEKHLDLLV